VGTGTGSANDIQSGESANSFANTLFVAKGANYGLIGERGKTNFQAFQIENE
jgi:hypothetical protein